MWPFYREFTCVVCGGKGIDRSTRQDAKYCSEKCRRKAKNQKVYGKSRGDQACLHNEGVVCNIQKCEKCGWNPDVEKRRKEAVYGR